MSAGQASLEAEKAILVVGDHEFFVEEAAEEIRREFREASFEVERVSDESLASLLPEALSTGSLFAPRRLVEADLTPLFGRIAPGRLVEEAVEAWRKNSPAGRREAFRKVRELLASVPSAGDSPAEIAAAAARKTRKPDCLEALTEILQEMPESRANPAAAVEAVLAHLQRGLEGTVLLARAVDPVRTTPLYEAFRKHGHIRDVGSEEKQRPLRLASRARKLAAERKIQIEPAAVERLLRSTDAEPRPFASELEKLLDWAAEGGRVTERDVAAIVDDRHSEDIFAFFESFGERRRNDSLRVLSAILSGQPLRAGDREFTGDDPLRAFFGLLVKEIRRLCLIRARGEDSAWKMDPAISFGTYQARVHPKLAAPVPPFGEPLAGEGHPYGWYKSYQRSCRFRLSELTAALIRCSEADAAMKDSAPAEDVLTQLVSSIV